MVCNKVILKENQSFQDLVATTLSQLGDGGQKPIAKN